jgi:hypothetical protein
MVLLLFLMEIRGTKRSDFKMSIFWILLGIVVLIETYLVGAKRGWRLREQAWLTLGRDEILVNQTLLELEPTYARLLGIKESPPTTSVTFYITLFQGDPGVSSCELNYKGFERQPVYWEEGVPWKDVLYNSNEIMFPANMEEELVIWYWGVVTDRDDLVLYAPFTNGRVTVGKESPFCFLPRKVEVAGQDIRRALAARISKV